MKPLLYKITGVWGNHEGSMLLFLLILSGYGAFFSIKSQSKNKERILYFQSIISFLIILYIYFVSNPFDVNPYILKGLNVEQGLSLNPLLQDIGLAMHPPLLYLGYAGFSICFAYSLALLKYDYDVKVFSEEIRGYVLFSWAFLGFGIALGSWWAYRELGWGGFWFWDPVENTSLIPWLLGGALLHTSIYTRKFQGFSKATIILSLTTFLFSLVGFFLVRSGLLSSVHSFAASPSRGLFMLFIVFVLSGYAAFLYGTKISKLKLQPTHQFKAFSRQNHLSLNLIINISLTSTILLGLFYPIILDVLNIKSISVGEPYFNKTFVPISILLALLAVFTPFVKWHSNRLKSLLKTLPSLVFSALLAIYLKYEFAEINVLAFISIFTGLWLFTSILEIYIKRVFYQEGKITRGLNVLLLSHGGFGLLIVFISLLITLESEVQQTITKDNKIILGDVTISFEETKINKKENYLFQNAKFEIEQGGKQIGFLNPENRVYFPDAKKTYEADLITTSFADYYLVMGQTNISESEKYSFPVRFYIKPFMAYVWLSMFLISFGGIVALYPRKK